MFTFTLPEYTELPCVQFRSEHSREYRPGQFTQFGENIPETKGVYFLVDDNNKIEYIGSALNFRKRLNSHYNSKKTDCKKAFLLETSTLVEAQLFETLYICHYKPKKNLAPNIRKQFKGHAKLEAIIQSKE